MAKNDILLIDQIVSELSKESGASLGEAFQAFAIGEVLKDYDLSPDEIELGLVDGRDDGGIDAWFTFVDGDLISETDDIEPRRTGTSLIEAWIFTAKHHDTFRQEPVVNLYATALDMLDLATEDKDLTDRYNDGLIAARNVFKDVLIKTARSGPQIRLYFCYVSRGDRNHVGGSINARSSALLREVNTLLSNCKPSFEYLGAAELLARSRKLKDFAAVLRFDEGPISRGGADYVGLAKLDDYMRFICDADGRLRRYLFESNVRDYEGGTYVNRAILATLKRASGEAQDFWWLNNGVTVIADKATLVGKELHLENVQIVNGLQTTESVYMHFMRTGIYDDERCILVKVLVTAQKVLADQIILAANNQNKVDFASLRATDKIQRDIEDILATKNWFYDRRKNYYLNHGKPRSRIVSMTFMSWAVMALHSGQPYQCNRARPKYMQSESTYRAIFSEDYDLTMYLAALELSKVVEALMLANDMTAKPYQPLPYATMYRFLYTHLYGLKVISARRLTDKQIIALWQNGIDVNKVGEVHDAVLRVRERIHATGQNWRRLHRSEEFQRETEAECLTTSV
jgi:AIPR protein